jgi:hypothetical protein
MNKFIIQAHSYLIMLLLAAVLIASCKKEVEQPTEPARLFKPSDVKVAAGPTSAKLTWTRPILSAGGLKYSIDFSTDSTFATVTYTATSDTTGVVITDENLTVRTPYYARVKAVATSEQPESRYLRSASFQLSGVQLFLPVRDSEIKETNVGLRFTPATDLTSIVVKPETGTAITVNLTAADAAAGIKSVTGLTGSTKYTAELFAGTKSKGITSFTTLVQTVYTQKLSPGEDLALAISSAANGSVIGLEPGTYTLSATTFITQKSITLKSTSGNPSDTKVNFREFDIEGTGAGVSFSGIEFDGTAASATYFINFIGSQAANASPATFTNVSVDNCIVHGAATSFLRADRGAAARDFKITAITVNNSILYELGANGSSAYYTFHLNKLQFNNLTVSNSTLYNAGPGLVTAATTVTADIPVIVIRNTTVNGFGGNAKYALLDASANPVSFSIQNSIIANTPKSGLVNAAAVRATGTGSTLSMSNSNYFNLATAASGGAPLTFGTMTFSNIQTQVLNWTTETTVFTLPAGSPLRTASNNGTAIGDPRWTY